MTSKWHIIALLFSVTVNVAVVGTMIYFWQHSKPNRLEIMRYDRAPQEPMMWFHDSTMPPPVAHKIDSMRSNYREQLAKIQTEIAQQRHCVVLMLQQEPVDRDSLDKMIKDVAENQVRAERLTIDHLLSIKPLVPAERWQFFIRDIEKSPRIVKRIQINRDDARRCLIKEEIEEIHIFEPDKNQPSKRRIP
jgi:hypothetical protein